MRHSNANYPLLRCRLRWGQSIGEYLDEVDPGDSTPPVLTIDDAKSIRLNLTYSSDGKRLATGTNYIPSSIRVCDAATGKQLLKIQTQGHAVMGLEFTPDGSKLVGLLQRGNRELNVDTAPIIIWDSRITVWSLPAGKILYTLPGHDISEGISCLTYSPDGQMVHRTVGMSGSAYRSRSSPTVIRSSAATSFPMFNGMRFSLSRKSRNR